MKAFKQDGLWWDASAPDEKWYGTLRFDARRGTRLAVVVPCERPTFQPDLTSRAIVHGQGLNGKTFTLLDCHDGQSTGSFFGVPRPLTIRANALIAGFQSDVADPALSTVSVSLRYLREWWGHSGIVTEPSATHPYFSARYEPTEPTLLHAGDAFRVSVRPSAQARSATFEVSMRDWVGIEIKSDVPRPFSEFERVVTACQDFLSIACAAFCDVDEISLLPPTDDDGRLVLGTYHASPRHRGRHQVSSIANHQLFGAGTDPAKLSLLVNGWLAKERELFDARMLYLEGVYGGGVVEHRLLALTQAVEAYHRRFCSGDYMDLGQYQATVLAPLTNAIPVDVSRSHRDAIAARLKFANEYSQSKRFVELFRKYSSVLELLVPQPAELVKPLIDTRNEFTHFPVPQRSNELGRNHSLRIIRYNWVLRLLLEACFMEQMGFAIAEIRASVAESGTYRQIAEWLKTT